jgi:hypothetical protein
MACAAGLFLLALAASVAFFVAAFVFPFFAVSFTRARWSEEQMKGRERD